jgi:hypothetical protein
MINKIFKQLGSLTSHKEYFPKPERSIYIGVFRSDGFCFGGIKTEKKDIDVNCKKMFETYPEASVLNVTFLNNKTKIINRND